MIGARRQPGSSPGRGAATAARRLRAAVLVAAALALLSLAVTRNGTTVDLKDGISAGVATGRARQSPEGAAAAAARRPQHKFLLFFSGHQGSSALADMLAAHPAVFIPGFEPLDVPGLSPEQKLAFLEATFAFPDLKDPAAVAAWRAALQPPVPGLRMDAKQLRSPAALVGKSVAGFKMRPYPLVGVPGSGGPGVEARAGSLYADMEQQVAGLDGAAEVPPISNSSKGHTAMSSMDPHAVKELLARQQVKVVLTLRRNMLKEALSWHKARDLGVSQFTVRKANKLAGSAGGSGMQTTAGTAGAAQALAAVPGSGGKLRIDVPRVLRWLNYTEFANGQLRSAVAFFGRPTLTVWYEDFQERPLEAAAEAAAFIGVPGSIRSSATAMSADHAGLEGASAGSGMLRLSSKFKKAGPDAIENWVENFQELCRALEGSPYYRFLNATACTPSAGSSTANAHQSGSSSSSTGSTNSSTGSTNSSRESSTDSGSSSSSQGAIKHKQVQQQLEAEGQLMSTWCLPADKSATGWEALSDEACTQRFAAHRQAMAAAVRNGTGTLLFKHVHKAGGSTMCKLAFQNMAAESPSLPFRKDWDTNCAPYEAFLGPHPAVGSGGAGAGHLAAGADGVGRSSLSGGASSAPAAATAARRLHAANWLGGACWLGFLTPPQLRTLPRHFAPLTFVASEGPLPDAVPLDAPLAWVTMLRSPVDRVLSSYRWWQYMTERMPFSAAECHAYQARSNATLEEWLDAYPDNWMVRELVGRTALYGRSRSMTEADLLVAQKRLHLFAAVLLLERPGTSMGLIGSLFGWHHVGWDEHRAGSRAGSDAASELPLDLLRKMERRHALDVRLYRYAEALHEAQAQRWLGGGGAAGSAT